MTQPSAHNRPVVARASRSFSARAGLVAIFAGIFGLVAYVWLTTPAEEPNIAQDAGRLALALDTAIRERGLALDSVTNTLAVEGFLKEGVLARVVGSVRKNFPDFQRLEVIDRDGAILAIAGDLQPKDAALTSRVNIGGLGGSEAAAFTVGWVFTDDPLTRAFYLTRKRSSPGGKAWFIRARFTRDAIDSAASHASLRSDTKYRLLPIVGPRSSIMESPIPSGASMQDKTAGDSILLRSSGNWWSPKSIAEKHLRTAGWIVSLERDTSPISRTKSPLLLGGLGIAAAVPVLWLVFGASRRRKNAHVALHPPVSSRQGEEGVQDHNAAARVEEGAESSPSPCPCLLCVAPGSEALLWESELERTEREVPAPAPSVQAENDDWCAYPFEGEDDGGLKTAVPEYLDVEWVEEAPGAATRDEAHQEEPEQRAPTFRTVWGG
jgi:hypothetical protein